MEGLNDYLDLLEARARNKGKPAFTTDQVRQKLGLGYFVRRLNSPAFMQTPIDTEVIVSDGLLGFHLEERCFISVPMAFLGIQN